MNIGWYGYVLTAISIEQQQFYSLEYSSKSMKENEGSWKHEGNRTEL